MRAVAEAIGWAVISGLVVYAMTGAYAVVRIASAHCAGGCW